MMKNNSERFPKYELYTAITILIVLLLSMGGLSVRFYRTSVSNLTMMNKISNLRGDIPHLDDIHTRSVRRVVVTQMDEKQMKERHAQAETQLRNSVDKLLRMLPEGTELPNEMRKADYDMREMEKRTFSLFDAGQRDAALKLIFSQEYGRAKDDFYAGLETVDGILMHYTESLQHQNAADLNLFFIGLTFSALVVLAMTVIIFRLVTRWNRTKEHEKFLEELDIMKKDFIAMAAHELNTPVSATMGALAMLVEDGHGKFDDRQNKYLKMMQRNTERLIRLVSDLLDVAKMESGHFSLVPTPVDLRLPVKAACDSYTLQASERGVHISFHSVDAETISVLADTHRVEQVVLNLIRNATRFAKTKVDVRLEDGSHQWCIVVENDGPRLDPADIPHLFDKFYRGKQVGREKDGSGLGLAIVKNIVTGHGGTVIAENMPYTQGGENGVRFVISLPKMKIER